MIGETSIVVRILVVDDDPWVSEAIVAHLRRPGFKIKVTEGPDAGMQALAASTFDLMLIDIFMPNMRGYQSIRLFHERAPAIPLIAMSAHGFSELSASSQNYLKTVRDLGATRFLRKPFTPITLRAAVNECLAGPGKAAARP